MGTHPLNLGLRFVLELAALAGLGWWGWSTGSGGLRWVLVVLIPVVAAVIWGTFNVPEDPSRSGKAPVAVAGWIRLTIEIAFFGAAFSAWNRVTGPATARIFAALVIVHYASSYDRIQWLLDR